jgi:hypothetical protein
MLIVDKASYAVGNIQSHCQFGDKKNITLKRGVRQRDPISPYIFHLAMDFLAIWIFKLQQLGIIHPPFIGCRSCLQYANDTLLLLQLDPQQLLLVKFIFQIFEHLSALKLNMQKSEILVTQSSYKHSAKLENIIGCRAANFPLTYLSLPLSDKSLLKEHYQSLMEGYKNSYYFHRGG